MARSISEGRMVGFIDTAASRAVRASVARLPIEREDDERDRQRDDDEASVRDVVAMLLKLTA